jgi:hypothetical protein
MPDAIRFRTLRDYAATYRLSVRCPNCGREIWLNPLETARRVRWDADLRAISQALRCSGCGSRSAEMRIIHDGRPA